MRARWLVALVSACALSCDAEVERTPEQRGAQLLSDPALSGSRFNGVACTTCHAITTSERLLPGAPLAGALRRPSFWGGAYATPRDAVEACATYFMRASSLDPESPAWRDVWAYLRSIEAAGPTEAQPFTVVRVFQVIPRGDAGRGALVWDRGCANCHGTKHRGVGRLESAAGTVAPIVPEETIAEHGADGPAVIRSVIVEKIRHGSFVAFSGQMPPFAPERLSDAQMADLLTYLDLF